jgi:hypothetical protein
MPPDKNQIVHRLRGGRTGNRGWILVKDTIFHFLHNILSDSGVYPASIHRCPGSFTGDQATSAWSRPLISVWFKVYECAISGFFRGVNEIFALLDALSVLVVSDVSGPIGCPETLVINYQYTLHKVSKERRYQVKNGLCSRGCVHSRVGHSAVLK